MAAVAHLSAFIAMLLTAGWFSFVGPLVVWLLYKDRSEFVRQAAAGSFNFNVWATVMNWVAWILFFTVIGIPVAIVLWLIAGFGTVIWHGFAALKALRGSSFHYPVQLRVLR